MRIAVFGAGGIGGYLGGRLGWRLQTLTWSPAGRTLRHSQEHGLRVHSVRGDFATSVHATEDPAEIGACDCVPFCVKAYDTDEAAEHLSPLLHEKTAVVSLQNGVDNETSSQRRSGSSTCSEAPGTSSPRSRSRA